MATYKKFSTTKATALSSPMTSGDVTVLLVDGSTYPDPAVGGNGPYTVLIGYGSDREEVVTVTAKPSTNVLTVTRAEDGSAATAKNLGDVVVHGVSARDFNSMATIAYVDAAINAAVPAGMIAPFGTATPQSGWLLCNGQSTTGYPLLAAMYGATVPDLRDKFILGDGGSLPNTGGQATVTLQTTHMPSHSHGGTTVTGNATHNHGGATGDMSANSTHNHHDGEEYAGALWNTHYVEGLAGGLNYYQFADQESGDTTHWTSTADTQHNHSITSASAAHAHDITAEGSGTAHENLPPYYALTFQVRAG